MQYTVIAPQGAPYVSNERTSSQGNSIKGINDDVLRQLCESVDMPEIDMVIQLAHWETGHYKSDIFIKNNNLFGMKYHRTMPTVATREENGHAYYENYLLSVIDLKLYFMKYGTSLNGYSGIKNYKRVLMYGENPIYL